MWPDRVSNPEPPTYESGVLPIALRGPATALNSYYTYIYFFIILYMYIAQQQGQITSDDKIAKLM